MNKLTKIPIRAGLILSVIMIFIFTAGCKKTEYGIGPVKDEMKLAGIDDNLVAKGKSTFELKCVSCHKFESRLVGPPLRDVTKRRRPEWIMNQMLNPLEMTQQDPVSKELFAQYLVQMTFQDVNMDDARSVLEYFRAVDAGKVTPAQ